jgi:hypothetical protein
VDHTRRLPGPLRGQHQAHVPGTEADWITLLANVFYAPAIGLFYFLVMQGVAQGLNLGLDIFYELHPDQADDTSFVEEK